MSNESQSDFTQTKAQRIVGDASRYARRPIEGLLRRWHSLVARKTNSWFVGEMYIEYDATRHTYIMAGPHSKNDPDQFQVGHTAGKLATMFGLLPLVFVFIAIEVLPFLLTFIPVQWVGVILSLVFSVYLALATIAIVAQVLTIGVEYQVVE